MMNQEQAIQKLLTYRETTGKTQSEIAKELDISDPQLSQFLNGIYKAPHIIIPKIERFFELKEKKETAPEAPEYKETSISNKVYKLIEYCHIQGKIAVAYGDAGVGKTMAIKEYAKKHPDESIVITVSPCFASITGVNDLIAEQLRIREKVARKIYSEAVAKLRGSNKVLIIDEAQHLTVRVINHLRCMSDESGIGIAFIGNDEIYLKMRGSGQASYAQLYSRIAYKEHITTNSITEKDISLLFEENHLDKEVLALLLAISRTNYGIRGAVNVFVNTAAVFEQITRKNIAAMAIEMNIRP